MKYNFMNVPVGANKKYVVYMDNKPFAGFDSLKQAKIYVAAQKSKVKSRGVQAYAATRDWVIKNKG